MAKILPFRAWRYNKELSRTIDELTSPLFDVISEKQRDALYAIPYNSIHLSVPLNSESPLEARHTITQWKEKGIIEQDPIPGIYVYYQHFALPGSDKNYVRKGFVSFIEATDWGKPDSVILRHENTIPHSVADRVEVLKATELNVSPTHGLYFDPDFELEQYMDESQLNPIYETEDYQGVKDVLSVIHDRNIIQKFIDKLGPEKIILADGHHRLESSIQYRQEMVEKQGSGGHEGFNFHLMYLTNGEADDLRILPTHRLINGINDFSREEFMKKLEPYFFIRPIENPYDITEIILGKQWAFGLLFKDETFKVRLKPEALDAMEWNFPEVVKRLDLTVMHYFIIEKALGIKGKDQRKSRNISFERNFATCLSKTIRNEAQFAIITKEISMDTVKEVCHSGYTLPQKSTYFYPKVICGYLFGSIKDDEFTLPFNPWE
ncbi:DUF1015 domain-containing protein [Roseivirga sp. UBA1976]|jgi:uncharacterized protein (DUF1015 family)|uniref:DUF1015 domain-containing protein n=1 Tax=Roseivirga sp. UBA1976 TaxID=1947386 RepID=UPI00257C93FF|nr:DUF1015 domain-containing protein [Roseivirga sp. UBA1976]|tara:strand:- start:3705 stop:5009 length:1305 start_codon:yes stop_codon:yes gene_type:complete